LVNVLFYDVEALLGFIEHHSVARGANAVIRKECDAW
jgi:hypothetical protein